MSELGQGMKIPAFYQGLLRLEEPTNASRARYVRGWRCPANAPRRRSISARSPRGGGLPARASRPGSRGTAAATARRCCRAPARRAARTSPAASALLGEATDSQTGVIHRPCPPLSHVPYKALKCASPRALGLFCATVPPQNRVQQMSPECPDGPLVRQTVSTWLSSGNKPG
jgi:hypothetical protein